MAKAIKVPTVTEMEEYLKSFKEDPIHNRINDADHAAMHKPMSLRQTICPTA